MRFLKVMASAVATLGLLGLAAVPASAAPQPVTTKAAVVQPGPNTVAGPQIKDKGITYADYGNGSIFGVHLANNTVPWLALQSSIRNEIRAAEAPISTARLVSKAVTEDKLSQAVQDKLNATTPAGPEYLANWGEIFRNTIKGGHSELGQSSAGEALNLTTTSPADQTTFGNEADFVGKPVSLTAAKFEVFTTGENSALGNNMPAIKVEMTRATGSPWTYTTLVYVPENSTSNTWSSIDAAADPGKHWGFSGAYFNGADMNDKCGMNGARCTLSEALALIPSDAKFLSVAVGKGRDYEFHGAVRSLTINGTKYTFTKDGVTK